MSERQKRKVYHVRRTVDGCAAAEPGSSINLRRALVGVAPGTARRMLARQEEEAAQQLKALEGQIALEQAEKARLQEEVRNLKRRLSALHNVIQVFRDKLAKERAAKGVLAARLLDLQEEETPEQESAAGDMRYREALTRASLNRMHDAVRDLTAALYRTVAGRDGIPTDLEVSLDAEQQDEPDFLKDEGPRPHWHDFLVGKKAGRTLQTADGKVLIKEEEVISPEVISQAEEHGLLFELILTMKVVPDIPDL